MFGKSCLALVILGLCASSSLAQSYYSYFGDDESREVNIRDLIGKPVSIGSTSGRGGVNTPSRGIGGSSSTFGGGPPSGGPLIGPCDDVCTKILEPLCGDDGLNYNNRCILKNASCRSQLGGTGPIGVAYDGFCRGP